MAMSVGPQALVVLSPAFVAPFETHFILQERVFGFGDSFDVRDANGQPAFRLQGAAMSAREVSSPTSVTHRLRFCRLASSREAKKEHRWHMHAEKSSLRQIWAAGGDAD